MGRESSTLDLARSIALGHDLNVEMRRSLKPRLSRRDKEEIRKQKIERIANGLRESQSTT